jgi:hypothetical protein
MRIPTRGSIAVVGVTLVAAIGLAGCGRDGGGQQTPQTGQVGTTEPGSASPTPTAASPSATPILEDGEHYAFLTSVKVGSTNTVTFDLIEFLTGDDANKACVAHKAPECPPPNDYFIVNDNPKLRTLPASPSVAVKVLASMGSTDLISISFGSIPSHFAGVATSTQLSPLPFKLVVSGGAVVAMEEIFLP